MTLAEALTLAPNTNIPSLSLNLHNRQKTHKLNDETSVTVYSVSDENLNHCAQLRVFHKLHDPHLEENSPCLVQSSVTEAGMKGVYLNKFKDQLSIQCDEFALFKQNNKMEPATTNTQPVNPQAGPPYALNDLQSYFGKTYVDTLKKMQQVDGVTQEQAHQAALAFLEFIPKAWFGEKLLP